ncbi:alpha/beta hydrolase [Romboutsia sp.]|uniref:alpha/beta hydrolase n=1 Tax=Romboutsia sp. TaxID=1965302 RepID=UPI003F3FB6AB
MSRNIDDDDRNLDNTFSITMELQKPIFEDKIEEQTKEKKSNFKRNILIGAVGILLISAITLISWVSSAYKPLDLATSSLVSDNRVEVNIGEFITFTPTKAKPTKGLILYPGAKVDVKAYAPLAKEIAESGYQVVLVEMPLNFAMISPNKAEEVIEKYPNIQTWAIGGHSLGGVSASKFAIENTKIDGVVLLASYPMGDELKALGKKTISIWGSKDGVLNFTNLIESKAKLPFDTTYVEIEGGNHAQFGDYGKQKGDHDAIISQQNQLDITSRNIVKFLKNLSN